MKLAIVFVCALGAVACKSKSSEEKGSGTASASGSGTASASGSGTASASGSGTASGSGSASASGSAAASDQFAEFAVAARKMCECKDIACLEATDEALEMLGLPDQPAPELEAKLLALEDEVQTCALKIAEATPLPEKGAAEGAKLLAEFQTLRDKICKCTDSACAESVAQGGEVLDAKVQEIYELDDEGHLPPAFEAVMKSAAVCFQKLLQPPR